MTDKQANEIRALGMIADMRYQIELNIVGLDGLQKKVKDSGLKRLTALFVENQKVWANRIDEKLTQMGIKKLMDDDLNSMDFGYYSDIMDSARLVGDTKNVSYLMKNMRDIEDLSPYMEEINAILGRAVKIQTK